MSNNLVIVESPSKAKTIKKYLGKNYEVIASQGHIIDLPSSKLGVDVDNDFKASYITMKGKAKIIKEIKDKAKKADKVYLATDPDREGEAIAWHLRNMLKIDEREKCRIEFNEITKDAVKKAINSPRTIDENLVNAQQGRRILDRIVGYKISPVLWKKVKKGLSAGRVQSVAMRIIMDREREIRKFKKQEYWTLEAKLLKGKEEILSKFYGNTKGKIELKNEEQVNEILKNIDKRKEAQIERRAREMKGIEVETPELWTACVHCGSQILKSELEENLMVCPHCDYHFRINATTRIKQLFDEGSFEELFKNVHPCDPLNFVDTESYAERLKKAHSKTGLDEAVITGLAKIEGHKIAAAVMDFDYMGGSMGSVVGEKVTRIMEKALELKLPMLAITSSGGARMQESALSLMQMAKTSCAAGKLDEAGLLYINLLTEPTFGGITASFGTLGDIIIAEQGARIGFAGRRVIEQTIRQKLPDDFQTAEYLLKFGQVDIVSKRKNLRKTLANILDMHGV